MPGLARVGDPVTCPNDIHGFPPFVIDVPVIGNFTNGSLNVFCNNRPAIRQGDLGTHLACPGPQVFVAATGSLRVLINSRPAVMDLSVTTHCGVSPGHVLAGMCSPNTLLT